MHHRRILYIFPKYILITFVTLAPLPICLTFVAGAASFGGGLVIQEATLIMADSLFYGNTAGKYGGGMLQLSTGSMDVRDSVFDGNTAGAGGGALAVATVSRGDR